MAQGLTDDQIQQLVESFEAKKKEMNPATAAKERMEKWVYLLVVRDWSTQKLSREKPVAVYEFY